MAAQAHENAATQPDHAAPLAQSSIAGLAAEWIRRQADADTAFERLQAAEEKAEERKPSLASYKGDERIWREVCGIIDAHFDKPRLEAEYGEAQRAANILGDQIADMHPQSIGELALKAEVVMKRYEDGRGGFDQPQRIHALLSDMKALAALEAAQALGAIARGALIPPKP